MIPSDFFSKLSDQELADLLVSGAAHMEARKEEALKQRAELRELTRKYTVEQIVEAIDADRQHRLGVNQDVISGYKSYRTAPGCSNIQISVTGMP